MEMKGILHCHSNYSYDAKLSLRELRDFFIERGIRFVCMTEHADELTKVRATAFVRECEELSDDTFLFIPGFEVPYRRAHILMIGLRDFFGSYAPDLDALRIMTRHAPFVVLAHPVRNRFKVEDGLLEQIDALEVWNQQYEGKRVPRIRSLKLYGKLKKKKPSLIATGGIDFHRTEHFSAPLVHLTIDAFEERVILEKLKTGAFTVTSDCVLMYGTLPNARELIARHRLESHVSVLVIMLGKTVNKVLTIFGLSLPKSFREKIRRTI